MQPITQSDAPIWQQVACSPYFCDLMRDGDKYRIHLRIGSSTWVSARSDIDTAVAAAYERIQAELVKERLRA